MTIYHLLEPTRKRCVNCWYWRFRCAGGSRLCTCKAMFRLPTETDGTFTCENWKQWTPMPEKKEGTIDGKL